MGVDHRLPGLDGVAGDEGLPHDLGFAVVRRESNAELPHGARGEAFAVQHHGEAEVFEQRVALLADGRTSWRTPGHEFAGLSEDPGVADASSSHADRGDAGVLEHQEDVLGGPDVAGSEDQTVGPPPHDVREDLPSGGTEVPLDHGATVHRRPGVAQIECRIGDPIEVAGHLGRVVEAASQLDGAGNRLRHRRPNRLEHSGRLLGHRQEVTAPMGLLDLLDRAGHVHIDDFVAHSCEDRSALGHLVGGRAHHLTGDRMVLETRRAILVEVAGAAFARKKVGILLAATLAAVDERPIEQGLGHAERTAVPTGDEAHGPVGVAGEPGLEERRIEPRNETHETRIRPPTAMVDGDVARRPPGLEHGARQGRLGWGIHLDAHPRTVRPGRRPGDRSVRLRAA